MFELESLNYKRPGWAISAVKEWDNSEISVYLGCMSRNDTTERPPVYHVGLIEARIRFCGCDTRVYLQLSKLGKAVREEHFSINERMRDYSRPPREFGQPIACEYVFTENEKALKAVIVAEVLKCFQEQPDQFFMYTSFLWHDGIKQGKLDKQDEVLHVLGLSNLRT